MATAVQLKATRVQTASVLKNGNGSTTESNAVEDELHCNDYQKDRSENGNKTFEKPLFAPTDITDELCKAHGASTISLPQPASEHYDALRNVCRYLRKTKSWGLLYWREKPLDGRDNTHKFPTVPITPVSVDPDLPDYPQHQLRELVGYVDAAHAVELRTRRSITGIIITFAGAAVAYKSKVQPVVATSSTEAELMAAVHAAKLVKYFRTILAELELPQLAPTVLYEDNQAAIAMVQDEKPTARARHIDIQWFAIQEWRRAGSIIMKHLPGVINNADAATKALGWVLHSRRVRRSMGHHRPWD